jgi:hypothetical protein
MVQKKLCENVVKIDNHIFKNKKNNYYESGNVFFLLKKDRSLGRVVTREIIPDTRFTRTLNEKNFERKNDYKFLLKYV